MQCVAARYTDGPAASVPDSCKSMDGVEYDPIVGTGGGGGGGGDEDNDNGHSGGGHDSSGEDEEGDEPTATATDDRPGHTDEAGHGHSHHGGEGHGGSGGPEDGPSGTDNPEPTSSSVEVNAGPQLATAGFSYLAAGIVSLASFAM